MYLDLPLFCFFLFFFPLRLCIQEDKIILNFDTSPRFRNLFPFRGLFPVVEFHKWLCISNSLFFFKSCLHLERYEHSRPPGSVCPVWAARILLMSRKSQGQRGGKMGHKARRRCSNRESRHQCRPQARGQVTVSGCGPLLRCSGVLSSCHFAWHLVLFLDFPVGFRIRRSSVSFTHSLIILPQAAFLKCGSPRVAGER